MRHVDDVHAAVEERLRAAGQRYTPKRRELVEALASAATPPALPDLTADRGLAPSSVYRNLAVLEQAGAVRRVLTEGEFARFELAEDLTQHHHHLLCSSCGRVEDVTVPASFESAMHRTLDRVAKRTGFATVSHRLDLIGTCRRCADRQPTSR
jgi:Fur family transcriptional regulator, ferric uptake regulator